MVDKQTNGCVPRIFGGIRSFVVEAKTNGCVRRISGALIRLWLTKRQMVVFAVFLAH